MRTIVAMLALAIAASASSAHAEFQWKHPGADPYATSRDAAMRTRESAFRKLGFPEPVVKLLMEKTKVPGKKIKLVMSSRLTAMLSKGGVLHKDVVLAWEAPIRGTELVAPAELWEVTWEGKVYKAFLFDVCNNWSSVIAVAPAPIIGCMDPTATNFNPNATSQTGITCTYPAKSPPAKPAEPKPLTGGCPDVWVLEVANWESKAFYLPGVERTHAQEKFGVKFVGVEHVSRTHGPQIRAAYAKGEIAHSKVPRNFRVSLVMTSEARNGDTTITQEKFYKDIVVTGSREVAFPMADIEQWDAIRVIAANGEEVLSPPTFSTTGFHEMRFFNKLPGTEHGEWDNPKQKPCYKTEHWIEQPQIGQKQ